MAHGTNSQYVLGCRCDACRGAQRAYRKRLRARQRARAEAVPDRWQGMMPYDWFLEQLRTPVAA